MLLYELMANKKIDLHSSGLKIDFLRFHRNRVKGFQARFEFMEINSIYKKDIFTCSCPGRKACCITIAVYKCKIIAVQISIGDPSLYTQTVITIGRKFSLSKGMNCKEYSNHQ